MSVVYLYHSQDPEVAANLTFGNGSMVSLLDHYCAMFGAKWAAVHPGGYQNYAGENYPTYEDAYQAYPNHTWVYLDPNADVALHEFEHPEDDVVYVVGRDIEGFSGVELHGQKVRLDTKKKGEMFSVACLIAVACNRWSRQWQ